MKNMKKMYATTEQAEQLIAPSKTTKCGCGETYALVLEEEQLEIVVCDACREDAPCNEQW